MGVKRGRSVPPQKVLGPFVSSFEQPKGPCFIFTRKGEQRLASNSVWRGVWPRCGSPKKFSPAFNREFLPALKSSSHAIIFQVKSSRKASRKFCIGSGGTPLGQQKVPKAGTSHPLSKLAGSQQGMSWSDRCKNHPLGFPSMQPPSGSFPTPDLVIPYLSQQQEKYGPDFGRCHLLLPFSKVQRLDNQPGRIPLEPFVNIQSLAPCQKKSPPKDP